MLRGHMDTDKNSIVGLEVALTSGSTVGYGRPTPYMWTTHEKWKQFCCPCMNTVKKPQTNQSNLLLHQHPLQTLWTDHNSSTAMIQMLGVSPLGPEAKPLEGVRGCSKRCEQFLVILLQILPENLCCFMDSVKKNSHHICYPVLPNRPWTFCFPFPWIMTTTVTQPDSDSASG